MAAPSKGRKCAEATLDLLLIEIVRRYSVDISGPPAVAALEGIGLRVGRQLAERYTRDRPRLGDNLEVVKFVCKEFWQLLFRKQVDNLKTNHRGVYVLQDHSFKWLQHLSLEPPPPGNASTRKVNGMAIDCLHIPCAIIKGALLHLGVTCSVNADIQQLPACTFTIRIQ